MKIYAKEGYILTNGDDVYAYVIDLGSKDSESNYHEITLEEYENILKEAERDVLPE